MELIRLVIYIIFVLIYKYYIYIYKTSAKNVLLPPFIQ